MAFTGVRFFEHRKRSEIHQNVEKSAWRVHNDGEHQHSK